MAAAFVALGAATLAYHAAMAKVHFDERTARENELRKILGIFLRFDFAVDVLKYEADSHLNEMAVPKSPSENCSVEVGDLSLSDMPEIQEAWENLDYFPVELSQQFYLIKNELYNLAQFKIDHLDESYPTNFGMEEDDDLTELRKILTDLSQSCGKALTKVRNEIAGVRVAINTINRSNSS